MQFSKFNFLKQTELEKIVCCFSLSVTLNNNCDRKKQEQKLDYSDIEL
jgi:hypothetical protein